MYDEAAAVAPNPPSSVSGVSGLGKAGETDDRAATQTAFYVYLAHAYGTASPSFMDS